MPLTSAEKQRGYRQRKAIEAVGNEYPVTLMLRECQQANIDIWPTLVEIATAINDLGGKGPVFIRNIAPLIFGVAIAINYRNSLEGETECHAK